MDPIRKYIQTVRGLIPDSNLGYSQSHEHLFIAYGRSAELVPSLCLDDLGKTCSELELYRSLGGASIVDAQPVGCGRMADYLQEASVRTGVNILASTGFHKMVFYPEEHWIHSMDEAALTELFTSEIEDGMFINSDNSKPSVRIAVKAGVIKTASGIDGPTGRYKELFSAAAEASVSTGVSVMSHTEMGKGAFEQIRAFTDRKVGVDSIIICHLDRVLTDMEYLYSVAETGVFMEFDTIGRFKYHSDEDEAEFITKLVERGFEDRILLGLDTTRERMKSYGGAIGLDHIFKSFIPLLKNRGISGKVIDKFTISNPAKAFSIKKQTPGGV